MNVIKTELEGVVILEPKCFGDHRGWFMETYSKETFEKIGITNDFIQDNHSMSQKKGTLRGLHFQKEPFAQAKLVRCTRGTVIDIAVDLRVGSPTYLKWTSIELSDENKRQFYIPRGFAHGFLCLSDNVEFQYKVDNPYSLESDCGIRYDDPTIGIDWGTLGQGLDIILSEKDKNGATLEKSGANFFYKKERD